LHYNQYIAILKKLAIMKAKAGVCITSAVVLSSKKPLFERTDHGGDHEK